MKLIPICPKCGAGLTGTRKTIKGKSVWWCEYCNLNITQESLQCRTLENYTRG